MDAYANDGERIYQLWDHYARTRDVSGLLTLYAQDAILETPLIQAILGSSSGILQGHRALRHFFEEGGQRRPNELVRWYREKDRFFFDGTRLTWEYPRTAPDGDQIDLVEVMDLAHGLIHHHRIYWGWVGVGQLVRNASSKGTHG